MRYAITIFIVLLTQTTVSWAACVTIDTSTWTVEQQRHLGGAAYFLATHAGHDSFPTMTGSTLCFSDPTFDPTMLSTTIFAEAASEASVDQQAAVKQQTAQTDLLTNAIQTLDPSQVDAVVNGLGFTVPQAAFLKAIVHYLVDNRVVGR